MTERVTDEKLAEWEALATMLRNGDPDNKTLWRRCWKAADAIHRSIAEIKRLRETLTKAAEQFEFYAREHRQKAQIALGNGLQAASQSAVDKALTNERFVSMCRAALPEEPANGH